MHWVDIVVAVIIGMSMVIGLFRGLIKESVSLATWILGIWLGLVFSAPVAEYLPVGIESLTVKTVIAFVVIFLGVLLVGGILNYIAGQLIDKTGLSGTDRILGMVFGVLRGGLIVAVLVLLANLTNMPQEAWWQESLSLPYFNDIALWIRDVMPESVARHFS